MKGGKQPKKTKKEFLTKKNYFISFYLIPTTKKWFRPEQNTPSNYNERQQWRTEQHKTSQERLQHNNQSTQNVEE